MHGNHLSTAIALAAELWLARWLVLARYDRLIVVIPRLPGLLHIPSAVVLPVLLL